MKSREEKKYWDKDKSTLWIHHFLLGNKEHGQVHMYCQDGSFLADFCAFQNKEHGLAIFYEPDGSLKFKRFSYKNKKVEDFPFLQEKPARKNYKSTRSRFQTLEIL